MRREEWEKEGRNGKKETDLEDIFWNSFSQIYLTGTPVHFRPVID